MRAIKEVCTDLEGVASCDFFLSVVLFIQLLSLSDVKRGGTRMEAAGKVSQAGKKELSDLSFLSVAAFLMSDEE